MLFRKEQNKMLEFIFEKIGKILDWSGSSQTGKDVIEDLMKFFGDNDL